MSDAVRIFVGCDPNDCDLEQMLVLDASLRRRTSLPLDITFMRLSRDPGSPWFSDPDAGHGWNTARWPTPFSGLRWGIPAACGGKGRALYLDADILCLADIAALWRMEIPPGRAMLAAGEGRRLRLGTMLLDNAAMARHLPPIEALRRDPRAHEAAKALFEKRGDLVEPLPAAWSNLDGDGMPADALRMLHYSDMGTQFSHRHALARLQREGRPHWFDGTVMAHPRPDLAALFDAELEQALADGYRLDDYRAPHFGAFPKKSEKRHRGNETTRGGGSRRGGLLGSLFGFRRPGPAEGQGAG